MTEVMVGLGARAYPIFIEPGSLEAVGEDLASRKVGNRYCIIGDDRVAALYGKQVQNGLARKNISSELLTFPAGEEQKSLATFTSLCSRVAAHRFDRKDAIIALGGGVSGDMAGFVAASYMRGIPFVQIPTSLLAQVDSSVGGKTGVDIPEGKNLVGAFYQPRAVYIDPQVLFTLDYQEVLGGLAEVIKYGVIWDASFFDFLRQKREAIVKLEPKSISEVIATCCRIKAEVVAKDEYESDLRRILNYGHTIGHAVEAVSEFSIIHGKAVAIGMVAAARIAVRRKVLTEALAEDIISLIREFGLPVEVPQQYDKERMKAFIATDKKAISGTVSYILPRAIGTVGIDSDIEEEDVDFALGSFE